MTSESQVPRLLAFIALLAVLGAGILAFVMTLNMRDETMPPIPSTEKFIPDLKILRNEMKDFVEEGGESAPTDEEGEPEADQGAIMEGESLEGLVIDDQTGDPIPEFEIGLLPVSTEEMNYLAFVRWLPFESPEGHFAIAVDQLAGIKQIAARADGYAIAFETIDPQNLPTKLVFRLKQGAKVLGRVLNTDRAPVDGARIYPTFDPNLSAPAATTGANGSFELTLPFVNTEPDSVQALAVVHDDYVPANFRVPGYRGDREHVEIILSTGGRVAGHVLRGGHGVPGATVRAQVQTWAEGPTQPISRSAGRDFAPYHDMRMANTDADGRYEISLLFPGEAVITLIEDATLCVETLGSRAIVEDQQTTEVNFELSEHYGMLDVAVQVRGEAPKFVHAEALCAGAQVGLRQESPGLYRATCAPVGPATLIISASLNDTMYRIVRDIEILADIVLEQRFDLGFDGTVRGTCAELPRDKHALVLALFGTLDTNTLADYDPSELMFRAATHTEPNPDGAFELTPLELGDYTIVAAFSSVNLLEETPTEPITYYATHAAVTDQTPVEVKLVP